MAAPLATKEEDDAASDEESMSTSEDDDAAIDAASMSEEAANEEAANAPQASGGAAAKRLPGRGPDRHELDIESEFKIVHNKKRNWTLAVKQSGLVIIDEMHAP